MLKGCSGCQVASIAIDESGLINIVHMQVHSMHSTATPMQKLCADSPILCIQATWHARIAAQVIRPGSHFCLESSSGGAGGEACTGSP